MTNILINKWDANSSCQINMATGCWIAGKRSLHIDNVVYYQILAAEINVIESAIDKRAENTPRKDGFDSIQPAAVPDEAVSAHAARWARFPPLVEELDAN